MRRLLLPAALLLIGPVRVEAQCLAVRAGSPYDFVAASNTLFQTDFSGDAIGEFPKGLEFKTGAMEVAEWQGKRALKASAASALAIPLAGTLPESFTVEVGVVNRNTKQVGAYTVKIYGGRNFLSDFATAATRANYGTFSWEVSGGGASAEGALTSDDADACMGQEQSIRLQVDGSRLKLFADQRRLASVPNANFLRARGIVIALEGRDDADNAVYLTGIRVAAGSQTVAQGATGAPAAPNLPITVRPDPSLPITVRPSEPGTATNGTPTATAPTPTSAAVTPMPTSVGTTPTGVKATSPTSATSPTATPTAATTAVAPTTTDGMSKASAAAATPMTAPANFGGVAIGSGKVQLVWSPVPGAAAYQVYYTTPTYSTPVPVNLQPITDTTLTTRELNEGSVTLTVVANFGATPQDNGPWGPKSAPVTLAVPRYMGKYRVSILGFKVNNETFDNPVETDGKRDEVYVTADVQAFDSLDAPVGSPRSIRTFTYGDVNNAAWQNSQNEYYRIKAGTASALGGLKTGDGYPNGVDPWRRTTPNDYDRLLPLLVWQGELIEDVNSVAIAPAIMESDDTPGTPVLSQFVASFGAGLAPRLPTVQEVMVGGRKLLIPVAKRVPTPPVAIPNDFAMALASAALALSKLTTPYASAATAKLQSVRAMMQNADAAYTAYVQTLIGSALIAANTKDRPVGASVGADGATRFVPWLLNLTYTTAEDIIAGRGTYAVQPGIIAIPYRDAFAGGIGHYTLYLEVKRF
jgi:hypothetical protein